MTDTKGLWSSAGGCKIAVIAGENFYVLHKGLCGFFRMDKPYSGIDAVAIFKETELFG